MLYHQRGVFFIELTYYRPGTGSDRLKNIINNKDWVPHVLSAVVILRQTKPCDTSATFY